MSLVKQTLAGAVAGLFTVLSTASFAGENTPSKLRYIELSNKGSYVISDIWVKWKEDGKTKSQKFTQDLTQDSAACFDLAKIGPSSDPSIPSGAEVWLEAQIALGEKKSCRKDKKHYYENKGDNKSNPTWYLVMKGETLTNNRCTNSSVQSSEMVNAGNSTDCE